MNQLTKAAKTLAAKYNSTSLILRIAIGLVVGSVLALICPGAAWIEEFGNLFVGALKGVAPVLVFVIVASALAQGSSKLDRRFGTVVWLYMLTTFVAAALSVVTSKLFPQTLVLAEAATADVVPQGLGDVMHTLLSNIVSNPVASIMNGNYIGILMWACLFGLAMKKLGSDTTKNFMAGLMIQNLSRELFAVADENGGKLKNRVVLFCDEFGTMPPFDILPLFSAGRSRRLTLVPIIQSLAQLEKNYGKEGCEIIQDNCQDTIFGGFAPNSQTAEVLSKALGSRTVLSGSVSRGKNDPSQSLQMMERALLTPDELKSIPKGSFIVMKTGTHPMRTRLQLFLNWGITFGEPYVVPERANRAVAYANRVDLERNLPQLSEPEEMDESRGYAVSSRGGIAHTPAQERAVKRGKQMKTFGEEER